MTKLLIIDGYAFLFRFFYGIKELSTSSGTPVNAIYGFVNHTVKMVTKLNPSHVLIALDSGKKSFRDELSPEYKANRIKTPDALIPQFSLLRDAIDAMGLIRLEFDGFEADDIIASAVKNFSQSHIAQISIASFDKDLMQLVHDPYVHFYDSMQDKIYGNNDVFEKFGVQSSQISQYLALIGDSSDNIKGIAGIGPKTAQNLLQTFGTAQNIFANLHQIESDSVRTKIQNGETSFNLATKLTALYDTISLPDIDQLKFSTFNFDTLQAFLTKYELYSILNSLRRDFILETEKKVISQPNQGSLF